MLWCHICQGQNSQENGYNENASQSRATYNERLTFKRLAEEESLDKRVQEESAVVEADKGKNFKE